MIYLKSFNLPKDTWVDEYFSPTPYAPQDLPDVYDKLRAEFDSRTIHRSWYPWKTFYNREHQVKKKGVIYSTSKVSINIPNIGFTE